MTSVPDPSDSGKPDGPTWQAIEYVLDPGGEDDADSGLFAVSVAWRGPGDRWAVIQGAYRSGHLPCFDAKGKMDYESSPSNRTDKWKRTHRFPLGEAMRLGERVLPTIKVNGLSFDDVCRWRAAGCPRDGDGRPVVPVEVA